MLKWLLTIRLCATHGDKVVPTALAEFGKGLK